MVEYTVVLEYCNSRSQLLSGSLSIVDSGLEMNAICHFCRMTITVNGDDLASEYECDMDMEVG